jgi:putative phosphoesterase
VARVTQRIAVIADTHDRVPAELPARLREATEIWHLGDVCSPETLGLFARVGPTLRVVAGNCDSQPDWPLTLDLQRSGMRFHLEHIPPRKTPAGVDVLLHGHTHVPRDETDASGVRWLNPGCITRPNRGAPASFAWLTIEDGKIHWKLVIV